MPITIACEHRRNTVDLTHLSRHERFNTITSLKSHVAATAHCLPGGSQHGGTCQKLHPISLYIPGEQVLFTVFLPNATRGSLMIAGRRERVESEGFWVMPTCGSFFA
jgi:hypothetical protein